MSDAYIIGADMIAFGRYPDRTPAQLGGEAALMALDDAGLTIDDVQVFYTGSAFTASASMSQQIMREIGQSGIPCVNVSNACASGA
ncbi:MAG: thiolase family protein, partial [Novosphingobium sp.]|nr:thiolase family protein [Novosphingobium sp.]